MNETIEYLQNYLNLYNIIFFVLLFVPGLCLIFLIKGSIKKIRINKKIALISMFLFFAASYLYIQKDLQRFNFYYMFWLAYNRYNNQLAEYEKFGLHESKGDFQGVKRIESSSSRQIYVLVLGESTTRHHMGIYNYPRETTPKLSKIKKELYIYDDVISPHTHTIASLSKILTLKNYEDEEAFKKGSIIQLMNQAGFRTFWLSNQRPIGLHENLITRIAQASSSIHFMHGRTFYNQTLYDETLLKPLERMLEEDGDLFIIIHLSGTHVDYQRRYPQHFNKFNEEAPIKVSDEGNHTINFYDNAVLYNDFVISEIIEKVRSINASSWVLYLSDHGEDVYRVNNSATHTESFGTYPMYDVPFILWTSPEFEFPESFSFEKSRKYMLDDLLYSVADLSSIYFKSFQSERSVFNDSFKQRERQIYQKKNYDSIYKEKFN